MNGLSIAIGMLAASPAMGAVAQPYEKIACSALHLDLPAVLKGVECGLLDVPESRNRVSTHRLKIAVAVAKATGVRQADPIIYVHGGPGIAALDRFPIAMTRQSWPRLRNDRDVIFFDMRGTGRSRPHLCPSFDQGRRKLTASALPQAQELERKIVLARACRAELERSGFDFHSHSAAAIADDMEDLRRALGYERWNIFGTSYGSLPALDYIRRYRENVRSLLLDSAFPPSSASYAEQLSLTAKALAAVQRSCDHSVQCRKRYPDVRNLAAKAIAKLNRVPIVSGKSRIDGNRFADAMWATLVTTSTVQYLPELLLRASRGDEGTIKAFTDNFGDDSFGGFSPSQAWMVSCYEVFAGRTRGLVAKAIEANPDLAGQLVADEQDRLCEALQPAHAPPSFFAPIESDVPTLIFAGEFDPATPAEDAYVAARFLSRATVLEVSGASHAPFYTDECTRNIGRAFFRNPEVVPDSSCLATREHFKFASPQQFEDYVKTLTAH